MLARTLQIDHVDLFVIIKNVLSTQTRLFVIVNNETLIILLCQVFVHKKLSCPHHHLPPCRPLIHLCSMTVPPFCEIRHEEMLWQEPSRFSKVLLSFEICSESSSLSLMIGLFGFFWGLRACQILSPLFFTSMAIISPKTQACKLGHAGDAGGDRNGVSWWGH
jgi:hypothetical protein